VKWFYTPDTQVSPGQPIFPRIELEQKETKMEPTDLMDITDFQKLDLRVAEVKQAEKVEGTDKLLKLQIDIGGEPRQIVAGIAQHYKPEELIGKKIVVVANLKPATIRGVESRGMLLAASAGGGSASGGSNSETLSILTLDRLTLPTGAKVK
jgi:methionyl-tRNA synthetase